MGINGISCCKCKEKPKEDEVIFPKKIKYNIYEMNKMAKNYSNNDNIMTNTNEQDLISRSSHGYYELEKNYESFENIYNNLNKLQKNNSATKSPFLRQINEKEQKYEQEIDDNSNNEGFCEIEKINVDDLMNDVDKLCKDKINKNPNNHKNNKVRELKRMNQKNLIH